MTAPQSLTGLLQRNARGRGDAPAIVTSESTITWNALLEDVARRSSEFTAAGVGEGDTVALYVPPSAETVATLLTLWRIGALAVPLNTRQPATKAAELAQHVSAQLLVTAETIPGARITTAGPERFRGEHHASLSSGEEGEPCRRAVCVFTSGSTGAPKAAVLSLRNLLVSAERANTVIQFNTGDAWLLALPLYHVAGLGIVMRSVTAGAAIAIPDPEQALGEAIRQHRPTHLSLVSTQLHRLLRDGYGGDLAQTKAILLGGSAIPPGLIREAHEAGLPIHTSYGMTETASLIACTEAHDTLGHRLTSGKPLANDAVTISPDGEILAGGATRFLGYLDPHGDLQQPFTQDGRFLTGDLGHIDPEGYLHVTARKDNQFISGGENIQPEEIEAALTALDTVETAIVVPKPHPEYGHRPVAFVQPQTGAPLDPQALRESLQTPRPPYKIPDDFHQMPPDLLETGMKPNRAEVKRCV